METIKNRIQTRLKDENYQPFLLSTRFALKYSKIKQPFGFNGLGELVYKRTYSRVKADGTNEQWYETVERVVNGTYNLQKRWVLDRGLHWDEQKAQTSAQEMYDRIFNMKFLPPGRGLWAMGSVITEEKGLYAALNNCGYVSTDNLDKDFSQPFTFLMDMSMLGVGVGFDVKGADKLKIRKPDVHSWVYIIPDTREGWVKSLGLVLDSYFKGTNKVDFDYTDIRPEGQLIRGFGGLSSGPGPLKELHNQIRAKLDEKIGETIGITTIVDIMNLIGKCVVTGNVRRSAEIVFGDPSSEEYLDLKNYKVNPHREEYGWMSNNSVFAKIGMDYSKCVEYTSVNGEPGYIWLDNIQKYSRMCDAPNNKDHRATGCNPCSEQTLESFELCCLVETFPTRHETKEDFLRTLKFAYLYAKTVTLGETHWLETNRVLLRNRRIGCSISGIVQFVAEKGLDELKKWATEGYSEIAKYDEIYSEWLCIPNSIKMTSVKPSGSVSLLAGATPGVHFPVSEYYIRRIRIGKNSELVKPLVDAGYKTEPAFGDETSTLIVEIPVCVGKGIRADKDVSMWEKMSLAVFMQKYWADNQVSATITFHPKTEGPQIKQALDYFQYDLKGISFLPITEKGAYKQMPYEAITERQYKKLMANIKKLNFAKVVNTHETEDKWCDGDSCEIKPKNKGKK